MAQTSSPRESPAPRNIGLLIEVSSAHARGLIRGISAFAQSPRNWRLHLLEQLRPADIRRWLQRRPCDGLIARVHTEEIAALLAECEMPVVNVTGATTVARWPRVDTDNEAVCALAAGHLIDRGYREFGYCGMPNYEWSRWRREYFIGELGRHGFSCRQLDLPSLTAETPLAERDRRSLLQWLADLPKPVGILAANDHCGRVVLEACESVRAAVPDEIGVIGVDNDDVECELCAPPLSSVEANRERIGYVAAEALERLLQGERLEWREKLIKPVTLVARRSTDATAVREPIVAEALRFIRAYAAEDIGSAHVALHVGVSRRFLEQQFRQTVGRTIHTEILRVRMETAQRLLGETDWKLQTVAERSGFKQAAHMSAVFFQRLRLRPGQYRRRIRKSLS